MVRVCSGLGLRLQHSVEKAPAPVPGLHGLAVWYSRAADDGENAESRFSAQKLCPVWGCAPGGAQRAPFPVLVRGCWHQDLSVSCSRVHQLLLLLPLKMSEPTSDTAARYQGTGFAVAKPG